MSAHPPDSYRAPPVFDAARAARLSAELALPARVYLERPNTRALIEALAGNSPYLAGLMLREPEFVAAFFERGPDAVLAALQGDALAAADEEEQAAAMRRLRLTK